ncbi:unannotated protein [freshwater metagenome]|uniref:Unannotated protein n=1 Tax=freshwater metagenome TaxID=449393 RepID=A0A6J6EXV2_9ZZZZ
MDILLDLLGRCWFLTLFYKERCEEKIVDVIGLLGIMDLEFPGVETELALYVRLIRDDDEFLLLWKRSDEIADLGVSLV